MLCQFSVKNYKSIRDEVTLDMQAASISEHTDRVIKDSDGQLFLPVSVIYGPNGGGKSNVLKALQAICTMVLKPIYAIKNEKTYKFDKFLVKPFAFSEETKNSPIEYKLFFRTKIAEYRYILHIKENAVAYERLDRIKFETSRKSSLFIREQNKIQLKNAFTNLKISDGLSQNLPLLSYLGITYFNDEIVNDVVSWFDFAIYFFDFGNPFEELRGVFANSGEIKKLVIDMIKEMDLDIEDFRIEKKDNNELEIFTQHTIDGYKTELTLQEESSGTRKLFGILPYIARALVFGFVLVIDELDAKIHPVLLKYIIMLFNDLNVNKHGAQLIFTSHDLSTMNSEIFRRDEIWFVAKGNNQNSQLYSLVEFKTEKGESVRNDARYNKQYLEGKYGADPYLRKIINWGNVNA